MPDRAVRESALYRLWEDDQKIAFGLTLLLSGGSGSSQFAPLRPLLQASDVARMGDASLHQCAVLQPLHERALRLTPGEVSTPASELLARLRSGWGVNHQLLAARALTLLLRGHLSLERFLRWAEKLSPAQGARGDPGPLWTRELWADVLARAWSWPQARETLERCLREFGHAEQAVRLAAICDWHDMLSALYERRMPPALLRLSFALLSAQWCWPLQIAQVGSGGSSGLVLPFFASLLPMEQGGAARLVLPQDPHLTYVPAAGERPHAFRDGHLAWDRDWHEAMRMGLEVGKALWRSQTGRMQDPHGERAVRLGAALCVDFGAANAIVGHFLQGDAVLTLRDRSAQVYWAQAVLGLLLPGQRVPLATATGTIQSARNGEYVLGDVEGLLAKLRYASQLGFQQRMILPRSATTLEALRAAVDDEPTRRDLLESNQCASVRDAADAVQESGWRRTVFLSSPDARTAFGQLARWLFEADAAGLPLDEERPEGFAPEPARRAHGRARRALADLREVVVPTDSPIAFVDRDALGEMRLGHWLALADHRVRSAAEDGWNGPGLGIVCLKTASGESSMRFWLNLFELLQVHEDCRERFQFGLLEDACDTLAQLLQNFGAAADISRMPAPDLLVVLDDAGFTRAWGRGRRFGEDERRGLHDLLVDRTAAQRLSAQLQPRDDARRRVLGALRILIVQCARPPATRELPAVPASPDRSDLELTLDALQVFRSGFSIHAARAAVDAARHLQGRPPLEWTQLVAHLEQLAQTHRLRQGRGQYFFTSDQLRRLRPDPAILFDAGVHRAAARAFAPIVAAPDLASVTRRFPLSVQELREARWHAHQAYAYAATRAEHEWARDHISLLGYASPAQDWDTVRELTFNVDEYGQEAFALARQLLDREVDAGSPPAPANFALAIHAAAQAVRARVRPAPGEGRLRWSAREERDRARALELLDWCSGFVRHHVGRGADAAARCMLRSHYAYLIQRVLQRAWFYSWRSTDARWAQLQRELARIEREHLHPAVLRLLAAPLHEATHLNVPLAHGWLRERHDELVASDGIGSQANWVHAHALCATDVHPSADSWLRIVGNFPAGAGVVMQRRVLGLWESRITDAFAFQARFAALCARAAEPGPTTADRRVQEMRAAQAELHRQLLHRGADIAAGWSAHPELQSQHRAARGIEAMFAAARDRA